MRIRFTSRLSLLILSFVAAMLIFPAMAFAEPIAPDGTTASMPTIQSDKDDYAPGETVTLTGSNWQPGESVHIYVNDDEGQTWSRDADVTADAGGQIQDQFQLPNSFVATYKVTATGQQSGVATTTFTDGNVKAQSNLAAADGWQATETLYTGSTDCTGTAIKGGYPKTVTLTGGTASSGTDTVGVGSSESLKLQASSPSTNGQVFINWTSPSGDASTDLGSRTICLTGFSGGGTHTYQANYGRGTTTTVARTGGPNPSTYGTALTFTATVTATGGNPSGVGTVTFKDGANTISGCSNVSLSGNTATCVTTKLAAGTHNNITAEYSGTTTGSPLFSSSTSSSISHTVTQKALTVTGVTASNKVYDGGTSAMINTSGASLSGVQSGDTVNLVTSGASGTFANKTVGNGKAVTITGLSLSGADAGNYTLTQPTATANITAKPITGTFTAQNKTYDGNNSATVLTRSLSGTVTGDTVSLSGGTVSFADKNVGNGKTVTLTGASLSGGDAGNYSLTSVGTTTANITAKSVTGSFTAQNKVYDGNTSATILTRSLSGTITGDTVSLTGGTATFDNANVGMGKTVTATGFTLTGADAGNYSLAAGPWTTTASIYYNYSGFLQPINDTAHQTGTLESKFRLGQTIPVKFELRNAAGNLVQQTPNPTFTKSGNRGACDAATVDETPPLVTPDTSNQYIYTGGQYHYNWSTKGLTAGEYRIYANLADGTQPYVDICLTK